MLAQGHPVFRADGSPTAHMRGVASNVLEFARRAARGLARSTPQPLLLLVTASPLGQCQQQVGVGALGIGKGEEELAIQARGPQVCSRMGIRGSGASGVGSELVSWA